MSEQTSIFSGLGLDKVSTSMGASKLTDGSYTGYVSDAKIVNKKDGTKSLILTYKVDDVLSDVHEEEIQEWRALPHMTEDGEFIDETAERNARFLKIRLVQLGVDQTAMDTLKTDDLIGIPCNFVVKSWRFSL